MKRLTVILLLTLYGFSSFGFNVHLKYCCGKLETAQQSSSTKMDCRAKKAYPTRKPCCETKDVLFKITSEQQAAKNVVFNFSLYTSSFQSVKTIANVSLRTTSTTSNLSNEQPPGSPPLFILNCNYRI